MKQDMYYPDLYPFKQTLNHKGTEESAKRH